MNTYHQEDFSMSEKAPHNTGEKFESLNSHELKNRAESLNNRHENISENSEKKAEKIEHYKTEVNEQARSTDEILKDSYSSQEHQDTEPTTINHELKEIAYQRI